MNSYTATLMTELRATIADLGKGGGSISPSVYDTAQVLRLHPPQDSEPAFAWLLAQQQADGGWGAPEIPYARDVPTLAAVLAFHTCGKEKEAVDAGLRFLRHQAHQWADIPIDALPIAAEMILPYLLEEASLYGLILDASPYTSLNQLRNRKLQQIAKRALPISSPPTYSWEALGKDVDSIRPDQSGGIGHSPTATAAWLRQAVNRPDLAEPCALAQRYLAKAAASTGLNIPGIVPNVWPITGFELSYGPYALLITGLLDQPTLKETIDPILDELWIMMKRGHGLSFGEYFTPDVDDTGLASAVLKATARPVDPAVIIQFKNGDHFCTFHQELNPSVFANAHAIFGLIHAGERYPAAENFLVERQCADGRWLADKLHISWLYTTLEVVLALSQLGYTIELKQAASALVQEQKSDGGWGCGKHATRIETSYAILTFATLQQRRLLDSTAEKALRKGYEWLASMHRPDALVDKNLWLGKEVYSPYCVDRIYELSALLSVALERMPV